MSLEKYENAGEMFFKMQGSYKNKCLLRKRFSESQKAFDKKLRFLSANINERKLNKLTT